MDLVTVLEAILTRWQLRAKLQCFKLYENLRSNNFRKTAVMKKKKKKNCKQKDLRALHAASCARTTS